MLETFWTSTTMRGESLMFVERPGGDLRSLLFRADRLLSLISCTGEVAYHEGRDYALNHASGEVQRLAGSRIPLTTREGLSTLIADGDDDAFHRHQVAATYEHAAGLWTAPVPGASTAQLPRTHDRLRKAQPLTVCLTGDSISEGYNASGFIGVAPHQPAFGGLVAAGLELASGSPVTFHNFAVAGWTADNGRADADRVAAAKPDLVLVAYGMNDACYADAADFSANIEAIVDEIHGSAPDAEFVLISPMLPSPECDFVVPERFPEYRDALAKLSGPGAALADVTTLWRALLVRKSPHDLSGNGLNHPNDFGHRLYAQTILASILPVAL
jgi:lysophospholipase L1-like esterase